jgi:hypothetical protein
VPLKFGHNDSQPLIDGQPALGWVSRVYREGRKLLADFTDMPTSIYEMVKAGLYKFVSVELAKNVLAGTREIPWVLDAVALLGADQPAVGTLKDLQSLTMRKLEFRARARVTFQRDTKFFSTGAIQDMDETQVQAAIAAALDKQATALRAEFSSTLDTKLSAAKVDADTRVAKAQAESHRAQIKDKFERAVKSELILPAKREFFYKQWRVDDDAVVGNIKLSDADEYIEANADAVKLAASKKPATAGASEDQAEAKLSAAEKVAYRARKLCFERKQDPNKFEFINAATIEVLKADKALGESYKRLEDAPAAA